MTQGVPQKIDKIIESFPDVFSPNMFTATIRNRLPEVDEKDIKAYSQIFFYRKYNGDLTKIRPNNFKAGKPSFSEVREAFLSVNDNFTSSDIFRQLVEMGYAKLSANETRGVVEFVRRWAEKVGNKSWRKNKLEAAPPLPKKEEPAEVVHKVDPPKQLQLNFDHTLMTEDACIAFLKEKGYRILKPIQEFKEI